MLIAAFTFSLIITGANTQSLIILISAYGQPDFPHFEVDDILGPYESTSQVTKNLSEKLGNFNPDTEVNDCVKPPYPPRHTCILNFP
jgi:hypothetical protein